MIGYLTPSPVLALALLLGATLLAFRAPVARRLARLRFVLLAMTIWSWLCCTPAITNALVARLEGPPASIDSRLAATAPDRTRTIVALGSGEMWTPGGTPAPRLDENGWERLHGAVRLARHTGSNLVFAGGPGTSPDLTLASHMGAMARELGLPAERVKLAEGSRSTYEDLLSARALLPEPGAPIWLVTSAVHMPRALAVARHLGFDARPFPVDFRQIRQVTWRAWIPDNAAPGRMAMALHEFLGRLHYRSRGWSD